MILELEHDHKFRFIFNDRFTSYSFDKQMLNKMLNEKGVDISVFNTFLNQLSAIITSYCDNEINMAKSWLNSQFEEDEATIEAKYEVAVELLITDDIKVFRKLTQTNVFNCLKNFSWGVEDKLFDVENSESKYRLGELNLVIQENNPFTTKEEETTISISLTRRDIDFLIYTLNKIKEHL